MKIRVLLPLSAALAILLGAFVVNVYRSRSHEIAADVAHDLEALRDLIAMETDGNTALMRATLELILQDEQLEAAFRARDRAALFALAEPLFSRLRDTYGVTHFYFTGADRVSFLRVHHPERRGGTIERHTLLGAESTGKVFCGLELGSLGTFTLRVVAPWFDDDDGLLGYVELGIEFERIINHLRQALDVHLQVLIEKELLDRQRWERGMAMLGREVSWDHYPTMVVVDEAPPLVHAVLDRILVSSTCPTRAVDLANASHLQIAPGDAHYAGDLFCLEDVRGREVGVVLMLRDVTGLFIAARTAVLTVAITCLVVGVILFAVFYWILDRTERRLDQEFKERQQAEQALRFTQFSVDHSADAAFWMGLDARFVYVNEAACRSLGYSRHELLSMTVHDIDPDFSQEVWADHWREIKERGSSTIESRHRTKDGHVFPVEVTANFLEYEGKEYNCAHVRNISERKRAEDALRALSGRYEAILAAVPDIIAEVDANKVYTWVNHAGQEFFGPEVVGRAAEDYFEGEQDTYRTVQAIFDGDESTVYVESWQRRIDGQKRLLAWWCRALKDARGNVIGALSTARDITDHKSNEEKLRQGNAMMVEALRREKRIAMQLEAAMQQLTAAVETARAATEAKSAFLANMSHEIRTPMTAILGFAESLLDLDLSPSEKLDAINTIRRNGVFLLRIINDILDLSKIEAGKFEIEPTPCSLGQLVTETQSLMQERADAKRLSFSTELDGPVPEIIQTDPTRLRQILINLIGNAVKFTETGHVRLVLRCPDVDPRFCKAGTERTLQFDIIDTGVGMTPEQLGRVFEPFSQADTSTTRRYGGTGLGLAISKRLAIMLGGDIAVESKPGAGSTFRLTIAAGVCDGVRLTERLDGGTESSSVTTDVPVEATQSELPRLACRILLVDDGPDNQRLIAFLLRKAGADVTVAENGRQAVDLVVGSLLGRRSTDLRQPFDVILMDMQMPVMDGYEATQLLRRQGYGGPIIALTAHAMAGDRDKCLAAGCDDYAAKPIERKVLIETIRRSIESRATAAVGRS